MGPPTAGAAGAGEGAPVPDGALVDRVTAGDADALVVLFERHAAAAYALALQVTGDPAFAGDAVVEVFLSAWRDPSELWTEPGVAGGPQGSAAADVPALLFGATHRTAVDAVRREQALRARRTEAVRDATRARELPGGLPADQREAFVLGYFGGYTQREVAALTGVPPAAVSARMSDALRSLRERLDPPAPAAQPHPGEEAWVAGWVLHALEPADEERVAAHLTCCPPCRSLARSYQRVLARLVVALPGATAPPGLRDTLRARVAAGSDAAADAAADDGGGRTGGGEPDEGRPAPGSGPGGDREHPEVAGVVPIDRVQRAVVWSGVVLLLAVTVGLGVWALLGRG